MLIYNFQKEFLGINEKNLNKLGYHDLSSLRSEVTDFADLFVKTPGYVHNFKHVHWIDFIDCADDGEIPKVIINANGKNFTANISISHAYLTDNPVSPAYLVSLNNLRVLSESEVENIHDDIINKPRPTIDVIPNQNPPKQPQEAYVTQTPKQDLPETTENDYSSIEEDEISLNDKTSGIIETTQVPQEETFNSNDTKLDVDFSDEENIDIQEPTPVVQIQHPHKKTIHKKEKFDNGYTYDPEVASRELGLPLDLIEEFIQDFIAQAGDFKPELYDGINDGDIDTVKTLSHKLKGVAANLRVEDAFEALATINTTSDVNVMKENLDLFYKIIAKLAGEEIDEVVEIEEEHKEITPEIAIPIDKEDVNTATALDNDDFILEFKDDENKEDEALNLDFKDEEPSQIVDESKPESMPPEVIYSKDKIAHEIGLDIESFNELFNDYIQESSELLSNIHTAIINDDYELLKTEAIKLKGMNDNMRVSNFNKELNLLINTSNQKEASELADIIKSSLNQLSIAGVQ